MQYLVGLLLLLAWSSGASAKNLVLRSDESKFAIPLDQFSIDIQWLGPDTIPMFISISQGSLTWKKLDDGNKLPQLIISIHMEESEATHFVYQGRSFIPEKKESHHIYITVDVFSLDAVDIVQEGRKIGEIKVSPDIEFFTQRYVYIDHSCSPFQLELDHTLDLFTSISCHFYPNHTRRGVLDVFYLPAESRLPDRSPPPYQLQLTGQGETDINLLRYKKPFKVKLKAKVPTYVAKLKTALGFGPYYFKAQDGDEDVPEHLTAAYMIYGRYDLTPTTSIRFFDALLNSGPVFNNFGAYFAYELGSTNNRRLSFVPLLGFQEISFRYREQGKLLHQGIFPQGGEVVYRHAFDMKNYHLIYGMFLSTSSTVSYENIWLRFGRKIFWELNWIGWKFDERSAQMWGLSVGVPFLSF
ncbi:hypothetical protein [Pseudobacteriovorax antillogorgiicola]|uniref:Uncharacterized protein n=1 Tax=Pseudobacteriovorax antillogorgiicola TaxID=1513793 RepID=A0A1Y6CP07_9BACT|nr:hypothetical protein [Pseudobacteriovorax antillogorgiicola]TCS43611.1 hypothetical protein EDD56_1354 [Pseudobacteriovorax antillogorgiicola]SMF80078.1 hypothetical protein SAMN06296036_13449 [Pseudobacteriovorax antillogorgiicola]